MGAWSLFPSLVVLVIGVMTRRVPAALTIGISLAALMASGGDIGESWGIVGREIRRQIGVPWESGSGNWMILLFLLELGVLVSLLRSGGRSDVFAEWAGNRVSSPRGAGMISILLSLALFIDDYFSTLMVGAMMRPLSERVGMARVKLAFLVDAFAAPLTLVSPISSWVAVILGFLRQGGLHPVAGVGTRIVGSTTEAYGAVIPLIAYSWLIMGLGVYLVVRRLSFGRMRQQEMLAAPNNEFRAKTHGAANGTGPGGHSIADFVILIAGFVLCAFGGILGSGWWVQDRANFDLGDMLRHADAAAGLFTGGTVSLVISLAVMRRRYRWPELARFVVEGIGQMQSSLAILVGAWVFGGLLQDELHTGTYLAHLFQAKLPTFALPAALFLGALTISVCLGTSWGAGAILFPLVIEVVAQRASGASSPPQFEDVRFMFILCVGALLSGAIAGDHISPISDTTVMSSSSTGADHLEHVLTQLTYAVPVIVACTAFFLIVSSQFLSIGASYVGVALGLVLYVEGRGCLTRARP